jgi:hypothetical protein
MISTFVLVLSSVCAWILTKILHIAGICSHTTENPCQHPRFNLNSMPGIADAELLPKFSALTGMSPDCPIPAYLRTDANLFFTNMAVFRGAVVPAAATAPVLASLPVVAPTASPLVAPTASPSAPAMITPSLDFMKVHWKHKTTHTTIRPHNYRSS